MCKGSTESSEAADACDRVRQNQTVFRFSFLLALSICHSYLRLFSFRCCDSCLCFFCKQCDWKVCCFLFVCLSLPNPAHADCRASHPLTGLGHLIDISFSSSASHFLTGAGRCGFVGQVNGAETSVSSRASAVRASETAPEGFQRAWLVAVQPGCS